MHYPICRNLKSESIGVKRNTVSIINYVLQHLASLMELYISANMVSSLRELFSFKSLCSLIVLDLTFNPVVTMDTYRPFVVFHLPFLKALDGRPIVS